MVLRTARAAVGEEDYANRDAAGGTRTADTATIANRVAAYPCARAGLDRVPLVGAGGRLHAPSRSVPKGGGARSLCWWRLGRRGQAGHGVGRDGRLRVGSAAPPPAGPPLTPSPPSTWYACRRPPAPPPTTRVNEPGRGSVGRTTGGPPCRRLAFRRRTTGLQPPPPALTPVLPPNAVGPCARALRHTCTKPARVTAGSTARWGGVRP